MQLETLFILREINETQKITVCFLSCVGDKIIYVDICKYLYMCACRSWNQRGGCDGEEGILKVVDSKD